MTYPDAVLADSPWGYWRLTETSGGTLADASPNARPMSITGTPTFNQSGPASDPAILWGDNVSAYANTPATVATNDATNEAWVYLSALPTTQKAPIVSCAIVTNTSVTDKDLFVDTAGKVHYVVFSGGASVEVISPSPLSLGTWHHIVASVGPAGTKLRIDKATVAGASATTSYTAAAQNVLLRAGGLGWNGSGGIIIAEPAFYTAQLSDTRADAHYDVMYAWPTGVSSLNDRQVPLLPGADPTTLGSQVGQIRLLSALGSDTTPGTELTAPGYSRLAPTFLTRTGSGYVYQADTLNLTGMGACEVVGWEGWDAAGSTRYTYGLCSPTLCWADAATGYLKMNGFHGDHKGFLEFADGAKVVFHPDHTPAGLTGGTAYYVRDSDGHQFRLATTSGGTALTLSETTPAADPRVIGHVVQIATGDVLTVGSIALATVEPASTILSGMFPG